MHGLVALILLSTVCIVETAEVTRLISTTERKPGDNLTFSCQSPGDHRFSQWYKQSPGKMIQTIAAGVYGTMTPTKTFNNTRFQFRRENNEMSLTIHSVKKEDEAVYFCQSGTEFLLTVHDGFLLVVKDSNQQTSVYVEQTPDAAAVQPGDTTSLQCSLFSTNSETRPQCPGENFVHWFKSGSGSSFPSIIHAARKSTDEAAKRSCVYHLSKTVENSSDFGTYYCAVAICGEMLLGDGSKLETKQDSSVLVLGGLLGCCVIVIISLIFYITGRRVSDSSEGIRESHHAEDETLTTYQTKNLDKEENMTYAEALNFPAANMRNCKKVTAECMYSSVKANSRKQQQL